MTTRGMRALAFGLALAIAAPVLADSNDVKDTATQKKAEARRKARSMKPGRKTLKDRENDLGDTARADAARVRKQGRKANRNVRHRLSRKKKAEQQK